MACCGAAPAGEGGWIALSPGTALKPARCCTESCASSTPSAMAQNFARPVPHAPRRASFIRGKGVAEPCRPVRVDPPSKTGGTSWV